MHTPISIFGLGYVGTVSAACLAKQGHHVIGVDINPQKVSIINSGHSPVIEHDIDDIVNAAVNSGHLKATTSASEGILESDVSLICVGTPSNPTGSLDLTFVDRVVDDIGRALTLKTSHHTVVLRSTVLPGTTEKHVIPALESISGRIAGEDLGIAYNPEFLREGTSVHDFFNPPVTVIGHHDELASEAASSLYKDLEAPLMLVPLKHAEMIKYANNAFHALKVGFANEIGAICKSQGIDSHKVMELFCLDTKLNLSPYYLKPGFAFGGSCLPKDLRAILHFAHRNDLEVPILESILPSNALQIQRGFEMVRGTGLRKVGFLGFSFKSGTDDLRESPLVVLIEMLLGKGFDVRIFDRNVSLARLHGANRAYIEKEIPHIAKLMCDSVEAIIDACDVVVVGNDSPEVREGVERVRPDQAVIDFARMPGASWVEDARYEGIAW